MARGHTGSGLSDDGLHLRRFTCIQTLLSPLLRVTRRARRVPGGDQLKDTTQADGSAV